MVNYWIYRMRMGQDIPSLDAIAMLDAPDTIKTALISSSADEVAMAK
jgi:hypothetical protein